LRALTLMMFLSAIISHFGEIHLGIAIAATRLHFWAFTGVMITVGYLMTKRGLYGDGLLEDEGDASNLDVSSDAIESKTLSKKSKRSSRRSSVKVINPEWQRLAILGGIVTSLLLSTLGFDFISNPKRTINAGEILWTSLTTLPNKDFQVSYGILVLLLTLWLAAGVLFTAENRAVTHKNWLAALGVTLGVSGGLSLLYWFIHSFGLGGLVRTAIIMQQNNNGALSLDGILAQAGELESVLTTYYVFLIGLVLLLARYIVHDWSPRVFVRGGISFASLFAVIFVSAALINFTNLRVIHADIDFKLADPFARGDDVTQWQYALDIYQRGNEYAPTVDHYYLFLGRAYLEIARLLQTQNPTETQRMLEQARFDLERAQSINPLNTDHTANLARLHRFWAGISVDPNQRAELAQLASDYYARAVVLSPNNVIIWNEWAVLYFSLIQDSGRGLEILAHSLEVDPDFYGTYAILAQYYVQTAQQAPDEISQQNAYNQAVSYYQEGISHIRKKRDDATKYGYLMELGGLQVNYGDFNAAIVTYEGALGVANNQIWRVEDSLARIYLELGDLESAKAYANSAFINAPDNQKPNIEALIALIQQASP
ncbi:MAG: hypothetical protein HC806_08925, partial [Anaerolineae bacterium]|nr:hypothetical protein [Anaerolineae bacterium]